jgi:hypothetical protein
MAGVVQKEGAMRHPQDRPGERPDRARGANMSLKLLKIVTDIKEFGYANLTRLTVLKKWFETPRRRSSFGIFIATQAARQPRQTAGDATELFRVVDEILLNVDVFEPSIPRTEATSVHACLQAFQNERRDMKWTSLRIIHDMNLFLVESGLRLYLSHHDLPTEGYRLAVDYCEHYDLRYGNGLCGPSADRIEEIAGFVLAIEAYEQAGHKRSLHTA